VVVVVEVEEVELVVVEGRSLVDDFAASVLVVDSPCPPAQATTTRVRATTMSVVEYLVVTRVSSVGSSITRMGRED